jgi:hypothetical protein
LYICISEAYHIVLQKHMHVIETKEDCCHARSILQGAGLEYNDYC